MYREFWFKLSARDAHTKVKCCVIYPKMDNSEDQAVIKYLQKKKKKPIKINDDMVQTLTVHFPSYANVKKWNAKFM